jgi:hypothetical protein
VEITEQGRGGRISYREGEHVITFDWDFAMSPALALLWGPKQAGWDEALPWAAGRQREIFEFVGADVVRQKASGGSYEYNLVTGDLTILDVGGRQPIAPSDELSVPYQQFMQDVLPPWEQMDGKTGYDLALLQQMTREEQLLVVETLTHREVGWQEVEALAVLDDPAASAAVDAASRHHLSADARLAAADAMHRAGRLPEFERFLAREIRRLNQPSNGLERALMLAAQHPSVEVRQALLWASYNATLCAPPCAAQLLTMNGVVAPFDENVTAVLGDLGLHVNSFKRDAAFAKLSALVGMTLDHDVEY